MSILDNSGLSRVVSNIFNLFARKNHTHDDRYYTESEVDTKLKSKADSTHTHTTVNGHTVNSDVPSNAKFTDTNTWTALKGATTSADGTAGYAPAPSKGASNRYLRSDGTWSVPPDTNTHVSIVDNLTSTDTGSALSANQGKVLKGLVDGKAASSHTHTKSQISDFPTLGTASAKDVASSGNASTSQVVMGNDTRLSDARKSSDVYAWAKASTKPSYTPKEIGAVAAVVMTESDYKNLSSKDSNTIYFTK